MARVVGPCEAEDDEEKRSLKAVEVFVPEVEKTVGNTSERVFRASKVYFRFFLILKVAVI